MIEWLIVFCNYYEMGCCKTSCEYRNLFGSWHVSAGRSSAVHGLFRRLVSFCENRASSDGTLGRKSFFESLKALETSGVKDGDSAKVFDVPPQALGPSRVLLPKIAGTCDPGDYLCGERAKMYPDLKQLIKDGDEWDVPLPRPCHFVSQAFSICLRKLLCGSGVAKLIEGHEVPRTRGGRGRLHGTAQGDNRSPYRGPPRTERDREETGVG